MRFWPEPKYFRLPKISLPRIKHVLRAKAIIYAGLTVRLTDEAGGEKVEWHYEETACAIPALDARRSQAPASRPLREPTLQRDNGAVEFAVAWQPEGSWPRKATST